ncbi:MAG: hypothetical protein ACJ0G9_07850 [Alphaproteobacteria bacterium]
MNSNNKLNCSLTGDSHFIKEMFLFKEMNNILICEVNAKVSEKGVWCNPLRCDIEKAIKEKVFDKLLNKKLKIPSFFMESIENNLRVKILSLVGLSKKAGLLKIGYDKLIIGLKNKSIDAVLIAKEDTKLNGLILQKESENEVLFNKDFSKAEIGKAIGYEKVLCVALLKSNLSQSLNQSLYKLNKFQFIK